MNYKSIAIMLAIICPGFIFSQGVYFEYKMTSQQLGDFGDSKTYSLDGSTRSEVHVKMMGMDQTTVTISKGSEPGKVYQLDVDKKTYTVNDAGKKNDAKDPGDYEVTVLGKEKINGFNATHVKVKSLKTQTEQELWTSAGVPGFEELAKVKSKYTGDENLSKALQAKGAWGFPVRIKVTEHGYNVQIDLVTAEKRKVDAAMFSLEGYTEGTPATNTATTPNASQQEMMQKLQNMTPEQRQQYMEQLKQQYGNQPH